MPFSPKWHSPLCALVNPKSMWLVVVVKMMGVINFAHKLCFKKHVLILENITHVHLEKHITLAFLLTILVAIHLGRLETGFGRLMITSDHFSFIELESFSWIYHYI